MIEAQPLVNPTPVIATTAPSSRGFARSMRNNALGIFPPEAFEQDVVFRKLFGRRQIIISRPAAIERILIDNPENYRRTAAGIRILRPLLGKGLLLSTGEDWRRQRRTLAPAFAPRTMPMLAGHVARAAGAAVDRLDKSAAAPVNLLAAMQFLALEIAGASMFSLEMERFGVELRGLIRAYAARLGRPSLLDFLLPPSLPSPRDVARWRFRRHWLGLIGRIIAARREQGAAGAPRDLFDLLSTARDPESGAPFPPKRLAVEVAGLDLGPNNAAAILPRLVYTRAVVHEALRLYPPAFTLARQAMRADAAGGIPIPARTVVLIAPWVLHHHRLLWKEPETFDPSRFLPPAPPPDRFAYLPFGIGPRVCIGAQFALTEATLVLATMIQAFHIERADDSPVAPRAVVTTQPDHPPPFLLRPRHE